MYRYKLTPMNKELIIRSNSDNVDFALLKDGKLIEFQNDEDNSKFSVGDVFLAKVRKSVPGLNAAFVNVGYHKDAFLHYHDFEGMEKTWNAIRSRSVQEFSRELCSGHVW